jgi:hypothetical protein
MNDISQFFPYNVADTCSLWNLLASRLLYTTAKAAGVTLCCTNFVIYECLHKPGQPRPERAELQKRLKSKLADGSIRSHPIDLEDLQTVEVLRNRKRVSVGELSVIVFAGKTQQAILTDDGGAQKLARSQLGANIVQSTPHLFAWLYFTSLLSDADKDLVASDLAKLSRNLSPHLDNFHVEAQKYRAIATRAATLKV